MALAQKFQHDGSDHPNDLSIGWVASILLHGIVFLGANYWYQAFVPDHKHEQTEPIAIELIEVPPDEATPPPETARRATTDSIAGGEAEPERPVSAAKSAPPAVPEASSVIPADSPTPEPPSSSPPEPKKPAPVSPDLPPLKPQSLPQETAAAPANPKLKPLTRQGNENLVTPKSALPQVQTRASPQTPSQAQRAPKSGAASSLGGPISLSSRDLGSDYQAALPNSNRFNPGSEGIDARRDVDLGPYLQQLQQRVKQQWIPGISQSSRRTVLYFAVNRSGQVSSIQIAQPSGSTVTDEAARNAVERAVPFAPLPTGYRADHINIQFTFNINVYGDLDLWAR